MIDEVVHRVIDAYGLDVERILPMQSGYRNKNYPLELSTGETANLIIYKREPNMASTIKSANWLGDYLHKNNFPARHTYDKRILKLFGPPYEQFAAVYKYLPGGTIPWEAYTMAHIKTLGQTMSNMHALLAGLPQDNLPTVGDVYRPIIERMRQYFSDKNVSHALSTKLSLVVNAGLLARFDQLMRISEYLPARQPLHMDFVRSNILFEPGAPVITGVLDFEKAAYGAPVFDIARTLAFLLVDCKYKTEARTRKYFLQSGYNKYGSANFSPVTVKFNNKLGLPKTIDVLESAIDMFLFHDFYKFLRHNPYESLPDNEHFVRTVGILTNRGVIRRP